MENYKFRDSINRFNKIRGRAESPELAYANSLNRLKPEPLRIFSRRETNKLDLRHFGMGDEYASALSNALSKFEDIKCIDLSGNNLKSYGISKILRSV